MEIKSVDKVDFYFWTDGSLDLLIIWGNPLISNGNGISTSLCVKK